MWRTSRGVLAALLEGRLRCAADPLWAYPTLSMSLTFETVLAALLKNRLLARNAAYCLAPNAGLLTGPLYLPSASVKFEFLDCLLHKLSGAKATVCLGLEC